MSGSKIANSRKTSYCEKGLDYNIVKKFFYFK